VHAPFDARKLMGKLGLPVGDVKLEK